MQTCASARHLCGFLVSSCMLLMMRCISPCQLMLQVRCKMYRLLSKPCQPPNSDWAILEFSECRFCSLQFEGPISDSSDISLAITAFLPRSAFYFSFLSVSQACHTSSTELGFDCWKLFWSLAVTGLIQDSVHWCGCTICLFLLEGHTVQISVQVSCLSCLGWVNFE